MFRTNCSTIVTVVLSVQLGLASDRELPKRIDSYLQAYVQSGNFSGTVLVAKHEKVVFEKAYGLADREHNVQNEKTTKFHIASLSMQFTATAVLRLVDNGALTLDETVGAYVVDIPGAE